MIRIKSGLPYRTISYINKDGQVVEVNLSTEAVNTLISDFLDTKEGLENFADEVKAFDDFDNEISYFVPDEIFLGDLEVLFNFLYEMDNESGIII